MYRTLILLLLLVAIGSLALGAFQGAAPRSKTPVDGFALVMWNGATSMLT
jgi:hypothetical protein